VCQDGAETCLIVLEHTRRPKAKDDLHTPEMGTTITQWVEHYKKANELMADISAHSLKRFMEDKD